MELLTLSSALDSNDICSLAENYYPLDFFEQEKINFRYQLKHFEFDVVNDLELQNLSSSA
jgi:hypothetical protein